MIKNSFYTYLAIDQAISDGRSYWFANPSHQGQDAVCYAQRDATICWGEGNNNFLNVRKARKARRGNRH